MSEYNPIELLQCLPQEKRGEVKRWMTACGVDESALTVPLVSLLASASELEDDGMQRVIAAMVAQEVPAA